MNPHKLFTTIILLIIAVLSALTFSNVAAMEKNREFPHPDNKWTVAFSRYNGMWEHGLMGYAKIVTTLHYTDGTSVSQNTFAYVECRKAWFEGGLTLDDNYLLENVNGYEDASLITAEFSPEEDMTCTIDTTRKMVRLTITLNTYAPSFANDLEFLSTYPFDTLHTSDGELSISMVTQDTNQIGSLLSVMDLKTDALYHTLYAPITNN